MEPSRSLHTYRPFDETSRTQCDMRLASKSHTHTQATSIATLALLPEAAQVSLPSPVIPDLNDAFEDHEHRVPSHAFLHDISIGSILLACIISNRRGCYGSENSPDQPLYIKDSSCGLVCFVEQSSCKNLPQSTLIVIPANNLLLIWHWHILPRPFLGPYLREQQVEGPLRLHFLLSGCPDESVFRPYHFGFGRAPVLKLLAFMDQETYLSSTCLPLDTMPWFLEMEGLFLDSLSLSLSLYLSQTALSVAWARRPSSFKPVRLNFLVSLLR